MLAIENSATEFEELEMSEHEMPGRTGLSLIAKASRRRAIRGGAICDAIGSGKLVFIIAMSNPDAVNPIPVLKTATTFPSTGKTVICIAIILAGLEKSRRLREDSRLDRHQTGATLVVVPPGLIDQWESEIRKFTTGLQVVRIYDNTSLSNLCKQDSVNADVVICPINILVGTLFQL
jgi:hypothetical protein